MSTAISRGLQVLELLTGEPAGLPLHTVASDMGIPKSAAHRTLAQLIEVGYVRQDNTQENYVLSLKVLAIAQRHLAKIPMVDLARPFLDRLAKVSGELARLSIIDGSSLVWVAKTQGAKSALRYDPDAGSEVKLSCTASGLAWLSTLGNDDALALVGLQGFADSDSYGPRAPRNAEDFLRELQTARELGYGYVDGTFEANTAAVAVPIVPRPGEGAAGVLNIAGPSVRLTADRAAALVPELKSAESELSMLFMDRQKSPSSISDGSVQL